MDHPDLVVTCIVGDGEAETGPIATAWHSHRFIDPKQSGAVLPILHLNGFKIASATIFATMPEEELIKLFEGYGHQPRIVGGASLDHVYEEMRDAMEWALAEIRKIQHAARVDNDPIFQPRWPMIILRTPKGWTCVKELDGQKIEGSFRSHQVPIKNPRSNPSHLAALEGWMRSYKVHELFDKKGQIIADILDMCPTGDRRMGCHPLIRTRALPLKLPKYMEYMVEFKASEIGEQMFSSTIKAGAYLEELTKLNPDRFRIFSPDELESNKLTAVLNVTRRCYQWSEEGASPRKKGEEGAHGGNVIEVLSEHNCQGYMEGYTITGRYALFPSYESFLGIVTTMMQQYAKFRKISMEVKWRQKLPSINYIETSTLWRQEHNGFSHQVSNESEYPLVHSENVMID